MQNAIGHGWVGGCKVLFLLAVRSAKCIVRTRATQHTHTHTLLIVWLLNLCLHWLQHAKCNPRLHSTMQNEVVVWQVASQHCRMPCLTCLRTGCLHDHYHHFHHDIIISKIKLALIRFCVPIQHVSDLVCLMWSRMRNSLFPAACNMLVNAKCNSCLHLAMQN